MMVYDVLYADPPWDFNNRRTGGSMSSGARAHYDTLSLDALCGLSIPMASRSICGLWVPTTLKFSHGYPVLTAWGFTYKTTFYWEKIGRMGMGFWLRNQVEELLIGVRGPVRPFRLAVRNIMHCPHLRHSSKPVTARYLLHRASTPWAERRLELFARSGADGWDSLGDALDGTDVRSALTWASRAVMPHPYHP